MIARICVGFLLDPWQMRPGMSNRSQALTTVCFREFGLTEVKRVLFPPILLYRREFTEIPNDCQIRRNEQRNGPPARVRPRIRTGIPGSGCAIPRGAEMTAPGPVAGSPALLYFR